MKVLLVNPPHSFSRANPLGGAGLRLPPLGLLGLAAYLRREMPGTGIKVLDCAGSGMTLEELRREAAAFGPQLAGVSVYTGTFTASAAAASVIRKACPSCWLMAGGPHASARPADCLRDFDGAAVGEGETVLLGAARALAAKASPAGVPGLATPGRPEPPRPAPLDADSLPFPARDLVDLSIYRPALFGYRRLPALSMVTSRGCPYRCGFCSKSVFGSTYRAQSPERVLAEMKDAAARFGAREITFQDDTFTADRGRVMGLCSLLKEARLDLTWSCMTRVDLVDPELLAAMKEAGCFSVAFGIDGGSDGACGLMRKGFDTARAAAAAAAARAAGIETRGYYILGYPGETAATLEASFGRIKAIGTDHVFFAFAHPFFGTDLYREAREKGLLEVSDEELLDAHDNAEPLVKVPGMTKEGLLRFCRRAYLRYYLRPASLLRRLSSPRAVADSLKALAYFVRWY